MERILQSIKQANAADAQFLFYKFSIKIANFSSHIWFIRECLREDLRPQFNFKFYADNPYTSQKLAKSFERKWLHLELRR